MAKRQATLGSVRRQGQRHYPRYERHGQEHTPGRGFGTAELAWQWLRAEQLLIDKDQWTPPADRRKAAEVEDEHAGLTFDAHARHWIEHRTTPNGTPLAVRTREEYLKYLEGRLAPLASLPLTEVTRRHVDQWWKANEDGHAIRAHAYAFMKSVFNDAVDREMIPANPCRVANAGRRVPQRPKAVQNELITSITHADVAALAEAMDLERWRAFVLLLAYSGLRPGEALALTRADLQQGVADGLPRWVVRVTKSVSSSRDKGQHLKGPKTAGSVRYVPIPPHMAEALAGHLERFAEPGKEGLVFPGTYAPNRYGTTTQVLGTSPKVRRGSGRKQVPRTPTGFYAARIAIGRPELRLYDLRAWARHAWRMAGISDFDCELLMGHMLPKVAGAYATLDRDSLWPHLDRLSEQAGWTPPLRPAPATSSAPSGNAEALAHILRGMDADQLAITLAGLPEAQRAEVLPHVPAEHLAAVIGRLADQRPALRAVK